MGFMLACAISVGMATMNSHSSHLIIESSSHSLFFNLLINHCYSWLQTLKKYFCFVGLYKFLVYIHPIIIMSVLLMISIIILSYHIIVILLFNFVACKIEIKYDPVDWPLLPTNKIPCKLNVNTSGFAGGKIAWVINISCALAYGSESVGHIIQ